MACRPCLQSLAPNLLISSTSCIHKHFDLIQTYSNVSKIKDCSSDRVSKRIQTYPNVSKRIQTYPNVSILGTVSIFLAIVSIFCQIRIQTYPIWCRIQTYPKKGFSIIANTDEIWAEQWIRNKMDTIAKRLVKHQVLKPKMDTTPCIPGSGEKKKTLSVTLS